MPHWKTILRAVPLVLMIGGSVGFVFATGMKMYYSHRIKVACQKLIDASALPTKYELLCVEHGAYISYHIKRED